MRILIIDDSTVNNMLMENILNTLGYESLSVLKGCNAIEKILEYQPHLVILDIMMPDKSGIDVLQEMRQQDIQVPVMIVSAISSHEIKKKTLDMGAVSYQPKPVNAKTLERRLQQAIQA
mgnify:CR=1 FL=1